VTTVPTEDHDNWVQATFGTDPASYQPTSSQPDQPEPPQSSEPVAQQPTDPGNEPAASPNQSEPEPQQSSEPVAEQPADPGNEPAASPNQSEPEPQQSSEPVAQQPADPGNAEPASPDQGEPQEAQPAEPDGSQPDGGQPDDPGTDPGADPATPDTGGGADAGDRQQDYENAWRQVSPRLDKLNSIPGIDQDPKAQEIRSLAAEIQDQAAQGDYDGAINQIPTITRKLDDYDNAAAEPIYILTYDGTSYAGTEKELAGIRQKLSAIAHRDVFQPLRIKADYTEGYCKDLGKLAHDNRAVASIIWVLSLGDASLGPLESAVATQNSAMAALDQAINGDLANAQGAYTSAVEAINAASQALTAYLDATDVGGNRTIRTLQFVEVVSFAIAAAAGAAYLAPAGSTLLTVMAANGIAGGGFGGLEEAAKQFAPVVYGDAAPDARKAIHAISKAVFLNELGAFLGSGAGASLKGLVVQQLMKNAALKGSEEAVEKFVEGAIGGAVQTVISNGPDVISGDMSLKDLAIAVAENMLGGGVGNILGGKATPRKS
jgi:hypothetical protein